MSGRRDFLAFTAGAVAARTILPAVARADGTNSTDTLDAELLRLGGLFDRAAAIERAAWDEFDRIGTCDADSARAVALNAKTGAIVNMIEGVPALTLAGITLKARVYDWCVGGDWEELEGDTTSDRFLAQIVQGLLALGSAA